MTKISYNFSTPEGQKAFVSSRLEEWQAKGIIPSIDRSITKDFIISNDRKEKWNRLIEHNIRPGIIKDFSVYQKKIEHRQGSKIYAQTWAGNNTIFNQCLKLADGTKTKIINDDLFRSNLHIFCFAYPSSKIRTFLTLVLTFLTLGCWHFYQERKREKADTLLVSIMLPYVQEQALDHVLDNIKPFDRFQDEIVKKICMLDDTEKQTAKIGTLDLIEIYMTELNIESLFFFQESDLMERMLCKLAHYSSDKYYQWYTAKDQLKNKST